MDLRIGTQATSEETILSPQYGPHDLGDTGTSWIDGADSLVVHQRANYHPRGSPKLSLTLLRGFYRLDLSTQTPVFFNPTTPSNVSTMDGADSLGCTSGPRF